MASFLSAHGEKKPSQCWDQAEKAEVAAVGRDRHDVDPRLAVVRGGRRTLDAASVLEVEHAVDRVDRLHAVGERVDVVPVAVEGLELSVAEHVAHAAFAHAGEHGVRGVGDHFGGAESRIDHEQLPRRANDEPQAPLVAPFTRRDVRVEPAAPRRAT